MRKRTTVRIITFLSAALIVAAVLAASGLRRARSLELYARAGTQRAFDELVTSVSELSNTLEKSVYVTDPALECALCTQMFGRAVSAQMAMGELPWSSQELENVSSFLSKVGDYACVLARTVNGQGGYSSEELENLSSLAETASVMSLNLQDMQARMMAGRLTMDEVYDSASAIEEGDEQTPLAGTAFQSIEAEFPELPTLIYDGPFSESMTSPTPLYLQGMAEVDETTARRAAARFLDAGEEDMTFLGDMGGMIPCQCYSAWMNGGEYTVYVTDQGGQILSALCSRLPGKETISVETALSAAKSFLRQQGLQGMEESYHIVEGGVLTVNFEFAQDGALCYPDLVKVGVAMDNGSIMSYDAKGYISCHRERELPAAEISSQEARQTVSDALTIRVERMAVIPSPGGEERLCYEFTCKAADGRGFILYVNAVTGAQEKILILLQDDAGTLTL